MFDAFLFILNLSYLSINSVRTYINVYKQSHVPLSETKEVFQQIRERMEAILKGIVWDHWSTVI